MIKILTESVLNYLNQQPYYSWGKTKSLIKEGLIQSYAPSKVISIINNKFHLLERNAHVYWLASPFEWNKEQFYDEKRMKQNIINTTKELKHGFTLHITFNSGLEEFTFEEMLELFRTMKVCGWYVAYIHILVGQNEIYKNLNNHTFNYIGNKPCEIVFRSVYGISMITQNLPKFCYHICPTNAVHKILTQGLKPKNNGRTENNVERTYLYIGDVFKLYNNIPLWQEIANRFFESSGVEDFTLLKINNQILKDKNIQFYKDDNVMQEIDGVYTFEPIPSNAIEVIDRIQLSKNQEEREINQNFLKNLNQ